MQNEGDYKRRLEIWIKENDIYMKKINDLAQELEIAGDPQSSVHIKKTLYLISDITNCFLKAMEDLHLDNYMPLSPNRICFTKNSFNS